MGIVSETVTTVENTQVIDSGKKETKSKPKDPLHFEVVQHDDKAYAWIFPGHDDLKFRSL